MGTRESAREVTAGAEELPDAERPVAPRRFVGKTAIVTGGATGIGLEAARRLAREGAAVLLLDLGPDRLLDAVARVMEVASAPIEGFEGDVTDPRRWRTRPSPPRPSGGAWTSWSRRPASTAREGRPGPRSRRSSRACSTSTSGACLLATQAAAAG